MQLLRNAAKLKPAALRKINGSTRGIERSYKLVQNGIQQTGQLIGAHRAHNDRQRARETLIRHPELRKCALELTVVRILFFDAMERHQNARRAAAKDARRCNRAGTNEDGNKGTVA